MIIINKEFAYNFMLKIEIEHIKTTGSRKNITQRHLSDLKLKKRHMIKLVALCSALKDKEKEIKELALKKVKEGD